MSGDTPRVNYIQLLTFCASTGYTVKAVRRKIEDGIWVEGREFVRAPDRRVLINLEGYEKWAAGRSPRPTPRHKPTPQEPA